MSAKHTLGPWKLSAPGNKITGGGITIAHVYGHSPETRRATDRSATTEDAANARLIAGAPELLAASQNALNVLAALATGQLSGIGRDSAAMQELRAAIARATGEDVE